LALALSKELTSAIAPAAIELSQPSVSKEAMIVLNKLMEENKIDFDEKIKYTDYEYGNELGHFFRLHKAQKSLKGITLQVDFIINL
jgi:hypothetical protein